MCKDQNNAIIDHKLSLCLFVDMSNVADISCENEPLDVQTFVKKHMEKRFYFYGSLSHFKTNEHLLKTSFCAFDIRFVNPWLHTFWKRFLVSSIESPSSFSGTLDILWDYALHLSDNCQFKWYVILLCVCMAFYASLLCRSLTTRNMHLVFFFARPASLVEAFLNVYVLVRPHLSFPALFS